VKRRTGGIVSLDTSHPIVLAPPEAVVPAWRHPLFQDPRYDPRYEWIEVSELGKPGVEYVRGQCRHIGAVPVESCLGELVAWLCPDCDAQLDAEWRSA
jgi:hypothetical protein